MLSTFDGGFLTRATMVIGACALIAVLAALAWLNVSPKLYTASISVISADSTEFDIQPLDAAASNVGSLLGGREGTRPFDLFIYTLSSLPVAAEMYNDETIRQEVFRSVIDPATGEWREPTSPVYRLISAVRWLADMPPWQPPAEADMVRYISASVTVDTSSRSKIVTIQYRHSDPAFARAFLEKLLTTTHRAMAESSVERSRRVIESMHKKISQITMNPVREPMYAMLARQYWQEASSSTGLPLGAVQIGGTVVSTAPVYPRVMLTVVLAALLGASAGVAILLFRTQRRESVSAIGSRQPHYSD